MRSYKSLFWTHSKPKTENLTFPGRGLITLMQLDELSYGFGKLGDTIEPDDWLKISKDSLHISSGKNASLKP